MSFTNVVRRDSDEGNVAKFIFSSDTAPRPPSNPHTCI